MSEPKVVSDNVVKAAKEILEAHGREQHDISISDVISEILKGIEAIISRLWPHPTPTPIPPPPPPPNPVTIMGTVAVQNQSDETDADVQSWIAAVKEQCDQHVFPIWGNSLNFVFVPTEQPPPVADWYAVFLKRSDAPGAEAYHDVGPNGEPLCKIFAETEREAGQSPSVGFSHEILESIADPNTNTTVKMQDPNGKPGLGYQEICDPCESSLYQVNRIDVSDFVTPDWFSSTPKTNVMDYLRVIPKQFQLAPGGYEEFSYDNGANWTEIDNFSQRKHMHGKPGSRHMIYRKRPEARVRSTFKVNKDWDVRVKK